jgi:UDP-N-acetylmuramate dehydrogenase
MMTAPKHRPLLETLPRLRGRVRADAPLAPTTWFRVGGAAELLVRPADDEDLVTLLAGLPEDVKLTILGAGSNVIVRDGGIGGVTVRLGGGFGAVQIEADGVIAGAACLDSTVAEHAAGAGLGGLAFLSGIPGSIGGAIAMNAGAYGGEIAQCLDWAEIATATGILRLTATELALSYRHAALPPGGVVSRVRLRARATAPALIAARMEEIRASRGATQPVRARTGGSTFANPPESASSFKAWELIEAAGCRGLRRGGAQVSELHCNFLLNTGSASAADIEGLGEDVRRRVFEMSGVSLVWEIRRLGSPLAPLRVSEVAS